MFCYSIWFFFFFCQKNPVAEKFHSLSTLDGGKLSKALNKISKL